MRHTSSTGWKQENSNLPFTKAKTLVPDKAVFPQTSFVFSCRIISVSINWQRGPLIPSPNVGVRKFVRNFALKSNGCLSAAYYTDVKCGVPQIFIMVSELEQRTSADPICLNVVKNLWYASSRKILFSVPAGFPSATPSLLSTFICSNMELKITPDSPHPSSADCFKGIFEPTVLTG